MKRFSLFLFLPSVLLSVYAETQFITPVVFTAKTEKPVIVDGVLDEPCWSKTLKINHFLNIYDNSRPASPQTSFQVVYDEQYIYFAITGQEPEIATVNRAVSYTHLRAHET